MDPVRVDIPLTVNEDDPLELVIAFVPVITKLPTLKDFCKSNVAELFNVRLFEDDPSKPEPEIITFPLLIVVPPL